MVIMSSMQINVNVCVKWSIDSRIYLYRLETIDYETRSRKTKGLGVVAFKYEPFSR